MRGRRDLSITSTPSNRVATSTCLQIVQQGIESLPPPPAPSNHQPMPSLLIALARDAQIGHPSPPLQQRPPHPHLSMPFCLSSLSSTILCTPERSLALARPGTVVNLRLARALASTNATTAAPLLPLSRLHLVSLPVGYLFDMSIYLQVHRSRLSHLVPEPDTFNVDLDLKLPVEFCDRPHLSQALGVLLRSSSSSDEPPG